MPKHSITAADIMPMEAYTKIRRDHKKTLVAVKRNRRLEVGPFATFHFENFDTMWAQIQEMLYIEKGGEEQIADELAAYNPLIPVFLSRPIWLPIDVFAIWFFWKAVRRQNI